MKRNDTNLMLKVLAEADWAMQEDDPVYITIVAGGQLISGQLISEDQFFALDNNEGIRELFYTDIKGPRDNIIKKLEAGEDVEFPNDLKEHFLYLKNASFIFENKNLSHSNGDGDGTSMQVRVSDISVFTYRGIKS